MNEQGSISALLSAAAVVGALTTSQVVTLSVDVRQLEAQVRRRTQADRSNDSRTRELQDTLAGYRARYEALRIIASLQWVVVTALVGTAGWLAYPCQDGKWVGNLVPFFLAVCALALALVVVPALVAAGVRRRLGNLGRALE